MTLARLFRPVALAAILSWASAACATPYPDPRVADIDAFVRKAMATTVTVPGLALAVVEGDEVVMTAGYGIADASTGEPVDTDTRFYIASSTKSFTALAIAAMAVRGDVPLDAPLAAWIGDAALAPDIAASVTLTDLLSHRSGLNNEPMAFRAAMSGDHSTAVMQALVAETVRRPEAPHGTFRYSNASYNLATTLLEGRFGRDWRALVEEEVLAPAGMTRTTPWISQARQDALVAIGHVVNRPSEPSPSPLQKVDATMQSAGGLLSTADDMARWLELQITDGLVDGRRVFPAGLVASTHRSAVAQDREFGSYRRDGYGLGWQVGRYRDELFLHHFGNFAGSRAHVSLMPGRRAGVAVLINEDMMTGELADLVANYVYDRLANRPDIEAAYEVELAALVARRNERQGMLAGMRAAHAARPWMLSEPLQTYVGTWENAAMGTMQIDLQDGQLIVRIGVMSAVAEASPEDESIRVELAPLQGQDIRFEDRNKLIFNGRTFVRSADHLQHEPVTTASGLSL